MGMDLSGKGGYFRFNQVTWIEVLTLAYDHGWKPAGTEPSRWRDAETGELCAQMSPDPETWESMDYFSNAFQWVTDEDAANIADALERACVAKLEGDEELGSGFIGYLREFITFCRAGGFTIA
jgi:hypothetical protein